MSSRDLSIKILFSGAGDLGKHMKGLSAGTKALSKNLAAQKKQFRDLNVAKKSLNEFRDLRSGLTATTAKLKSNQQEIARLARKMKEAGSSSKGLARDMARAKKTGSQLKDTQRKQSAGLQILRNRLKEAGISTKNLASAEAGLRKKMAATSAEIDRQGQKMRKHYADRALRDKRMARAGKFQSAGTSAMIGGAALTAPLVLAGQAASTFEDAMADVRKVVDFDTPKQFRQMSGDILALSKRLPIAAEGIAAIVAAGGQAGIPRKELLAFAEDAGRMGVAFDIAEDEAGQLMANWRTAFGYGRQDVLKLADQINLLGNTTAANAPMISDIVSRIGPLGEVGGLASGEIAALGATLGSMGIQQEIAATGIKNMMLALTKGEAATKKQNAAFERLGLTSTDIAKRMQQDAAGTITDVMSRISRLPKELQSGLLTELFGSESVAAIAPLLTKLDILGENFNKVGDASKYAGSMTAEYNLQSGTSSKKLTRFNNQIFALKVGVGNTLLPVLIKFTDMLGRIADRVSAFAERNPKLFKTLVMIFAAIAIGLVVFGGLALAIWAVMSAFAVLAPVFGAIAAGIALLMSPIGLIILAFAALAALIWYYWDDIKAAFFSAIQWVGQAWAVIQATFWKGVEWLTALGPKMVSIGKNFVMGIADGIRSAPGAVWNALKSVVTSGIDGIKSFLGIKSPSRVFMGFGENISAGLAIGIGKKGNQAVQQVTSLSKRVSGAIAIGSAATALAASPASAAGDPSAGNAGGALFANAQISITINPTAGQSPTDIATAVRIELERHARQKAAASRSLYQDDI